MLWGAILKGRGAREFVALNTKWLCLGQEEGAWLSGCHQHLQ